MRENVVEQLDKARLVELAKKAAEWESGFSGSGSRVALFNGLS